MDIKKLGFEGAHYTKVVQGRYRLWALANKVIIMKTSSQKVTIVWDI
jgi:hypothetical protein